MSPASGEEVGESQEPLEEDVEVAVVVVRGDSVTPLPLRYLISPVG